jgi:hypothetical protein
VYCLISLSVPETNVVLQVREAYEILIDPEQREWYELEHPNIHEQWIQYRRDLADWERRTAAEEEAEAARARHGSAYEQQERQSKIWDMGQMETARRRAAAEEAEDHGLYGEHWAGRFRCYCSGCTARAIRKQSERFSGLEYPTEAEYREYLQLKADEAERRTQKRREEQEREAQASMQKEQEKAARVKAAAERKRAAKLKVKDERSQETARRAREQQERDAQLRMAKAHIKEQKETYLKSLPEGGEAGEHVMNIGWAKTKGVTKCLFCKSEIKYYSFRCPDGGAIACNPCKNKMCRFTVDQDTADKDGDEQYGHADVPDLEN